MQRKIGAMLQTIHNLKHSLKTYLEGQLEGQLLDMKRMFHSLDHELYEYKIWMDVLEQCIINNDQALLNLKMRSSFMSFHRVHKRWMTRTQSQDCMKWQFFNKMVKERGSEKSD